ncbi:hypothetical protein [Nocardia sp. NPDC059228]|uniref:hypothetical protein n=1 Tax=Nocardia sp. NPDC059228 TaxID=3346777 RepID=UPI00369F9C81
MIMNPFPSDPTGEPDIPSTAEQLDEDALDADPIEEAADPPDRWEPTDEELSDTPGDDSLVRRLAAEEPDVTPDDD